MGAVEVGMVVVVAGRGIFVIVAVADTGDGEIVTCEAQEASKTAPRRKNAHLILAKINSLVKFKLISAHPISFLLYNVQ